MSPEKAGVGLRHLYRDRGLLSLLLVQSLSGTVEDGPNLLFSSHVAPKPVKIELQQQGRAYKLVT